ncbi:hypothetical protein V5738_14105 [Salinisphaera sp. SPP-AMP-43]|uniref:hypothetical protein n=1 Tax=Salinisphaera sp. SPP-AMP-43 TaxID=3121288 RepID=UPI003C6EA3E6
MADILSGRDMAYSEAASGSLSLSRGERIGWWVAACLASTLMTGLQITATAPFKLASFERLIQFQANEPFQCRVLVPALAAGLQHLAPLGTTLIFAAIEWLFWLLLIVVAHRALVSCHIGCSELARRMLALTILVPMGVQLLVPDLHIKSGAGWVDGLLELGQWRIWPLFYYPYDLPAAVFTLGLVLLLLRLRRAPSRRDLAVFALIFVLATLNRETTIFLLPCMVLLLWRQWPPGRVVQLLISLVVLFLAIELPLYWLFGDLPNPNRRIMATQYETHLLENLGFFTSPFYTAWFLTRFAGGLALIVLFWWRWVGGPLRLVLIGYALPLFLFGLWVGRLPEHRIFAEIVPLVWLSALYAIHARLEPSNAIRG